MINATVFWTFTIIYIVITVALAYLGYRKTKKGEDYLLAGGNVRPVIIGLSYGATFISTSAIVGFGGVAAQLGMGVIWLTVLCIGIGVLIAFVVYGKRIRKLGQSLKALTFPDLMSKRFNSPFLQYSISLILIVSMPLYASAVLIGGSRFLETTLGIDYNTALLGFALITAMYVLFGGLLAVMYTDAFQGAIMLFGMTAILIITFTTLGGVSDANMSLSGMASQVPAGLAAQGMNGWTAFPDLGSPIWWTLVSTVIMGVGIGVLAQPQLIVRYMTAKDTKSLNRAIPVGALFICICTGVAFTVGALTNVYFNQEEGKLSTQMASGGNIDSIIPLYINSAMPDYIIVLFMLTLLAAAMSTLSALFHTMGSSAGHDLWSHLSCSRILPKSIRKESNKGCSLRANRVGTGIMIMASVGLAFLMPGSIIARATSMFMGLSAAAFLPMLTYGVYAQKPSALAAKLSLVSGALTWFLWTAFVHFKESSVLLISDALFGKDAVLGMPWQVIDPLVIAIPVSTLVLLLGIFIDRRSNKNMEIE